MTLLALVIPAALAAWLMLAYNRLVRLRNQHRTAWADIDVQLQRRHDLVPRLVTVAQAYAAQAAHGAALQGQAEAALEQALGRLVALREAYPELKANQNFAQLSSALVEVEDHLQYARRFYNGAVRDYNDAGQRFPAMLVARGFGFDAAEFFQAESDSRAAPKLELAP